LAWAQARWFGGCAGEPEEFFRKRQNADSIELVFLFCEMREEAYDFFLPKKFDQTDFDSVCRCWTFNCPRIDCNPM